MRAVGAIGRLVTLAVLAVFGMFAVSRTRAPRRIQRGLAFATLGLAVVVVGTVLFTNHGSYTVKARFIDASQLVTGNKVEIGGVDAGKIEDISLTPDGQAEVTMQIDNNEAPLRMGTRADARQASLSGIANHYVSLSLPPASSQGHIPSGSVIPADQTQSQVDLDQIFNTFDPQTRASVQDFLAGSAHAVAGHTAEQQAAFQYLNPYIYTSQAVFSEVNRDTPELQRFLIDSSRFVTDVADRRGDLTNLVTNLNNTLQALGSQHQAVTDVLTQLPPFMRRADTTFVNLRSTLDSVDPLVDASKPVAKKLQPFLAELRPFAHDAAPTVHDLALIISQPGANNDLIELNRTFPPLAHVALDSQHINGSDRDGAFPETAKALKGSTPLVAQGRPYTPDLVGWFNDFSHTGTYDALGGISRIQQYFNVQGSTGSPPMIGGGLDQRGPDLQKLLNTQQFKRCPGGSEAPAPDRSNVFTPDQQQALDCREQDRATR
jgi:phospholipid/cholesterol/gamma-HCH transport system substrate-binding protein